MDSPLLVFGFVSLFHIIGAAVVAGALRALWPALREGDIGGCQVFIKLIWGAMFGGIPFIFGVQFARDESGTILFLVGQVLVWTTTLLVTLLAQERIRSVLQPLRNQDFLLVLFGGGFLLTGVVFMTFLTRVDRLVGWLMGGILGLVGAVILGFGLWRLLRSTE